MSSFFTYWAGNQIGDWMRGVTPTPVSALEVALYTVAPTKAAAPDDGTEVTGGAYTALSPELPAFTSSASANDDSIPFVDMPACTVVGAALRDGVSGQVVHVRNSLSISVTAGQTLIVNTGSLEVEILDAA